MGDSSFDYFGFLLFSLAIQFTPGPNNIMLAYSGMNFGFRRTLPHLLGVVSGVPLLMLGIGLGIDQVVRYLPEFQRYLLFASVALLLWLSWRVATTPPPSTAKTNTKPFRFIEAFLYQVINPKGWTMILTCIGLFVTATNDARTEQLYLLVTMTIALTVSSALVWLLGGMAIRRVLKTDFHFRLYNITAGLTLVGCAVYVLLSEL